MSSDTAMILPTPPPSVDLSLDRSNSKESHPRRILPWSDARCLVYGGNLGVLRTFQYNNQNDTTEQVPRHWDADEDIRAVAVSSSRVALGLDSGSTLFLSSMDDLLQKNPSQSVITGPTFGAPVRDMQFHPSSADWCAVATEEGFCFLHLQEKHSNSNDATTTTVTKHYESEATQAHDGGGVRALVFSPSGHILASLGMDGRLCLWQVTHRVAEPAALTMRLRHRDTARCVTKRDTGEILGADAADRSCRPLFLGSDARLLLPGETYLQWRCIVDAARDTGAVTEHVGTTTTSGHVEALVTFCAIPRRDDDDDCYYFVAAGRDKRLTLWSWRTASSSEKEPQFLRIVTELPHIPTDLHWQDDQLWVATADGTLTTLPGTVIWDALPAPSAAPLDRRVAAVDSDDDVFRSDAEEERPKKSNPFVDDEAKDDDDSVPDSTTRPTSHAKDELTAAEDDDARSYIPRHGDDEEEEDYPVPAYHRPSSTLQPPFAPSSSPLDLPRRFLCWNHVGSVTLRRIEGEEGRNIVDLHFTDSGVRRPISFTDTLGFILGSVGEDGGIFASDLVDEEDDDEDDLLGDVGMLSEKTRQAVKKSRRKQRDPNQASGSTIYFHRFETFASLRDKDWYLTLPNGERVLGCATGAGWAAVMTSRRFLRLFSSGGNQGQILWLDGMPITMVGRDRFLAVFFHQGEPHRDGTQNIGYLLMDAISNRVLKTGSTAGISAGATLTWAGFSSEGSLIVMDSEGMVSMLVMSVDTVESSVSSEWAWIPVLDTLGLRKASDDSYWPITVYEGKLICVPLKGKVKYPDATRRPVTATLSFKLPVARSTLASLNTFEELSIRAGVALSQKKVIQEITGTEETDDFQREYHALSAQVDKVTLKMFAAIVEAGKLERALDLVERLHLEKSFEIAMTIADHHRKLVDLIEDVKERRFSSMMMEYTADDESPMDSAPMTSFRRPKISPDNSSLLKRSLQNEETRHVRPKKSFA